MRSTLVLVALLGLASLCLAAGVPRRRWLQDRIVLYPHLINAGNDRSGRNLGPRIVDGAESVPHSRPFVVKLVIGNQYFCGGVLIGLRICPFIL